MSMLPRCARPKEAEQGRLVVITGGDPATLAEIRPVLDCFAEIVIHAGPLAAAHKMKLIVNFLALANAASVAEGFVAAMKSGVDLKALTEVAQSGGADIIMLRRLAKFALEGDGCGFHSAAITGLLWGLSVSLIVLPALVLGRVFDGAYRAAYAMTSRDRSRNRRTIPQP